MCVRIFSPEEKDKVSPDLCKCSLLEAFNYYNSNERVHISPWWQLYVLQATFLPKRKNISTTSKKKIMLGECF
jgi:hypothetical protein